MNTNSWEWHWRSSEKINRRRNPAGTTSRPSGDDPGWNGICKECQQMEDAGRQHTDVESQSCPSGSTWPRWHGQDASKLLQLFSVELNSVMGLDYSNLEFNLINLFQQFWKIVDNMVNIMPPTGSGFMTDIVTSLRDQTILTGRGISLYWISSSSDWVLW